MQSYVQPFFKALETPLKGQLAVSGNTCQIFSAARSSDWFTTLAGTLIWPIMALFGIGMMYGGMEEGIGVSLFGLFIFAMAAYQLAALYTREIYIDLLLGEVRISLLGIDIAKFSVKDIEKVVLTEHRKYGLVYMGSSLGLRVNSFLTWHLVKVNNKPLANQIATALGVWVQSGREMQRQAA